MIPFMDFSGQNEVIKNEAYSEISKMVANATFVMGPQVEIFEKEFAKYCGVRYAAAVHSGTDALKISLLSLGVGPGDEVIVPAHTFIATALCASDLGAKVVFTDVEADSYNMAPEGLRKVITARTKAIIPVHLYGQMADMEKIQAIADEHCIPLIEDACQAHGACYRGTRSGACGRIGCFSFYPTKGLGGWGDGGMIVTNDSKVFDQVKVLRNFGRVDTYSHEVKGFNSRLDTVQAIVLLTKLKYLDKWNAMRRAIAKAYESELRGANIMLPITMPDRTHEYQAFVVRVKDRDKVGERLKAQGIMSHIHYPIPIPLQRAYRDLGYKKGDFPIAENLAAEILSLPIFPYMTFGQVDEVARALKKSL